MTSRSGLSKVELAATAALLLAVLGVGALLLPRPSGGAGSPPPVAQGPTVSWDTASLEPARRAAGLPACPDGPGPAPNGPLAGLRLPCLGGPGTVPLGAALAGRDVLINLWASYCAPCRAELPALAEYAERPGAVDVVTVDQRDKPEAALALLADLGVKLPAIADPDGQVPAALHSPPALPLSYLLRADGTVVPVWPPVPFRSADAVSEAVSKLVSRPRVGSPPGASPVHGAGS